MGREKGPNANVDVAMASSPILQGVAETQVATLAEAGVLHSYRRGTYLCHQGDNADEVFFLSAGRVEISSISPTGTRVLHATVDTPQFLGELGVFGELPRSADMLALDESEIWSVDGERFLSFVTNQPAAAREVLAALARQVQESQAFVDDLLFLDLKGRVAKRLLQMGTPSLAELPDDGTTIPPVTHGPVSLCGGAAERVADPDLQRRGLIAATATGTSLRKVGALAKLAGPGRPYRVPSSPVGRDHDAATATSTSTSRSGTTGTNVSTPSASRDPQSLAGCRTTSDSTPRCGRPPSPRHPSSASGHHAPSGGSGQAGTRARGLRNARRARVRRLETDEHWMPPPGPPPP